MRCIKKLKNLTSLQILSANSVNWGSHQNPGLLIHALS